VGFFARILWKLGFVGIFGVEGCNENLILRFIVFLLLFVWFSWLEPLDWTGSVYLDVAW
jgi:hypothetical protein